jgi:cytochrome c553
MSTNRVTSPLPHDSEMSTPRSHATHRVVVAALVGLVAAAGCMGGTAGQRGSERMPARFGFGHPATAQEIQALDIDVRADGRGLPPDSGTAVDGAPIYAAQCAACHGADGIHGTVAPAPRLVGRFPGDSFPFATDTTAVATVGNWWPYATTLYDYIHRAMPFTAPGSLNPHQVYALVAFILARNDIIPQTAVMNARTLPLVQMPARNRFVPDDRTGGPQVR